MFRPSRSRPKSRAAARPRGRVGRARCRSHRCSPITSVTWRSAGPEARRGRHGRLRRPWPRRGRQVRDDRGAGQAAERARPAPRGRSSTPAGCPTAPGRPDRQGRQAQGLHRRRHLRRHPAPRRHEGLQEHHRHQQGHGSPDLRRSPTSASSATCTRCCRSSSKRSSPAAEPVDGFRPSRPKNASDRALATRFGAFFCARRVTRRRGR